MRLGPVRVAWLDQTPAGPAHAKMIREQRLTVQRLQGYVVAPVLPPPVPKPVVRDYAPPTGGDVAYYEPPATRSDEPEPLSGWEKVACALVYACIVALLSILGYAGLSFLHGDNGADQAPSVQQTYSQGFINTQDHAHGTYFQGATVICVTMEQGQWVEVPVTLLSADTLAAINTYQLPWKAKVGDSC